MDRETAKRWIVGGTVQGVGFRFFVQDKAAALGLSGWVRNLSDGRVEVYAIGSAAKLSEFAAALHTGPRMAHVRTVEEHAVEEHEEDAQNLQGFSIR
jgi:acylphosphatase